LSSVAASRSGRLGALRVAVPRLGADTLVAGGLATLLSAVAFTAGGASRLDRVTTAQLVVLMASGAVAAGAVLAAPAGARLRGLGPIALFFVFAGLTAVSIVWALDPADAWLEANQNVTYAAAFSAAAALAQVAPRRWSAVLGGVTLFALVVSAYALLTKVFPQALNPDDVFARLREPYGYWNAVGATAAVGIPGCLWLGARRSGHAGLGALAPPAVALLVATILLSYSRGALIAAIAGCALWFALVPLRLRGAAVLGIGGAGGLAVALWAFGQPTLSQDRVPVDLREGSGLELGILVVAVLGLTALAGLAAGFLAARRPPRALTRQRAGMALLVALALVPVGIGIALALSERGLGGSVSHGWRSLTDPDASSPSNDPGRLTETGSVRARYWNEALRMFRDNPVLGVGANGYATARPRYREDRLDVRHAHGFSVQILADLGILGGAAVLALLAAWLSAALPAVSARGLPGRQPWPPERVGMVTLLAVALVYGVHSFVDWTWSIPGPTVAALVAAGWLAGRGLLAEAPSGPAVGLRAAVRDRRRAALAGGVAVLTLVAVWAVWQPQRSATTTDDALGALERRDVGEARRLAAAARDQNPLAIEPLFAASVVETAAGRKTEARRALTDAVELQPSNPQAWLRLAQFELFQLGRPEIAMRAIRPALFLDPESPQAIGAYIIAGRQIQEAKAE
jgi:type II secretory pathway component PulM